jgi:Outer membrane protein beta-barrel domain
VRRRSNISVTRLAICEAARSVMSFGAEASLKTTVKLVVAALALLIESSAPSAAWAQDPAPADRPGFDLSVRTGFAIPFGKADADAMNALSDEVNGGIPLAIEGAARFNPMISAGLLFQWVPLLIKDTTENMCGAGSSCSGSVYHLGAELLFHFPQPTFVPWLGFGAGYEWLSLNQSANGTTTTAGANGFEFLMLQAGADVRLAPQFSLGGFVMLSFAQYDNESVQQGTVNVSADVANTSVHEWLLFGVRGTVGL